MKKVASNGGFRVRTVREQQASRRFLDTCSTPGCRSEPTCSVGAGFGDSVHVRARVRTGASVNLAGDGTRMFSGPQKQVLRTGDRVRRDPSLAEKM